VAERWRDIAGPVGRGRPGARNAISDVPGVLVGHSQAASGERTGVTVVAPASLPAAAGRAVTNGAGELTSSYEIEERGVIETPVYLCGTHALGTVYQGAIVASGRGPDNVVIPIVGECDDGVMADSRTVEAVDVERAREALGPDVAEGSVGAGTGMVCFGYPGGIGTSSRSVGDHHVGVLLLCNFGSRADLDLLGVHPDPAPEADSPDGSCIAVCATDAPLDSRQLRRLALRPLLGLARAGSYAYEGSGEIAVAFSAAGGGSGTIGERDLDPFLSAAWEAGHEAVLNCLVAARPATRLDGSAQDAFPVDAVRELAKSRQDLVAQWEAAQA
jgi:D-aminopeptidase